MSGMTDIGRFIQDGIGAKLPGIKSIQCFQIRVQSSGDYDTTINAVNVDASIVVAIPAGHERTTSFDSGITKALLTSATNLRVTGTGGNQCGVAVYVIEFDASFVRSLQSGTVTVPGGANNTAPGVTNVTISSVDPSRCIAIANGFTVHNFGDDAAMSAAGAKVDSATNLRIENYYDRDDVFELQVTWYVLELDF